MARHATAAAWIRHSESQEVLDCENWVTVADWVQKWAKHFAFFFHLTEICMIYFQILSVGPALDKAYPR